MLRRFIERPVLSTVISILIVVLGLIGLMSLPVEQYPNIAPPTVQVRAFYTGASADAVLNSVVIPLEEQINGVEGMTYITSSSSNSGMAEIQVFFEQGVDPDMAAVNVQNRVALAQAQLPSEVIQAGVRTFKSQTSNLLMIFIYSENPDYDGMFIQNYAAINIIPQIQRVSGVGDANVYGARTYSMRIWLKPDVMAAYGMNPMELVAALRDQNIEAAPGELGQNSNQSFQYTLKYTGRFSSPEEFANVVIRSSGGQVLRVKDVAEVELGSENYTISSYKGDHEAVMIAVSQTAGSNASLVIDNVKSELAKVSADLPEGIHLEYMMDASEFLDASINKVIHTLLEAFLLVFLVVFIFLQDWRSTLIPAIAVPVAIVGTFFFLLIFGFSINLLTLFALVLAIGIVVDDAIVVVEAVHAKLEAGEKSPRKAAISAMGEIAPAIVSITLVMAAVFVPVSFIGGTSGIFFKQFGLTLAVAILLSAVNALTLSPALCAIFLRPHDDEHDGDGKPKNLLKRFYYYFNKGFAVVTEGYKRSLDFFGLRRNRWIPIAVIVLFSVVLLWLMKTLPGGFIPQEDSGGVMGMVTLPAGSSAERTEEIMDELKDIAMELPYVYDVGLVNGMNFMSGMGSSYGSVIVKMMPWSERDITTEDIVGMLYQRTAHIKEAEFMFFGTPTIQGFGLSSGVSLEMQDRTGGNVNDFYGITTQFLAAMQADPLVMRAWCTFDPRFPQKQIEVDIDKIKEAGLSLSEVMGTLQAYIGSMYISDFNLYGKMYKVYMQSPPEFRSKEEDLSGIYVRNARGDMAPVTEFLTITDISGPQSLKRFNLYSSMSVTIVPAEGASTGDIINLANEVGSRMLPEGYTFDYSGMTREEVLSSNQTAIIFLLCLIFVYLLLAALYESYILPLAVLFSLPIGLAGVYIFIYLSNLNGSGIVNNIYVQISVVMLIGLLAKNAILIVEYAIQRRQAGMSIFKAAVNGAIMRLRPILMTSFAFVFGLMPLALSFGAGAIGNRSIGISAIGGMLVGTVVGVFVIPLLYMIFQGLQDAANGKGKKRKQ